MRGTSLNLGELAWEPSDDDGQGRASGTRWKLLFSARRTPTGEMSVGPAEIAAGGQAPLWFLFIFSAGSFEEIRYEFAGDG